MRMTIEEVEAKYPDKWVFLTELEEDALGNIVSGVPAMICSDEEIGDAHIDYEHNFGYLFRTTSHEMLLGSMIL